MGKSLDEEEYEENECPWKLYSFDRIHVSNLADPGYSGFSKGILFMVNPTFNLSSREILWTLVESR